MTKKVTTKYTCDDCGRDRDEDMMKEIKKDNHIDTWKSIFRLRHHLRLYINVKFQDKFILQLEN